MTKQEKIKQGMFRILSHDILDDKPTLEVVDDLLRFQSDNGVVIKVEGELPEYTRGVDIVEKYTQAVAKETQQDMLKAGYAATESLIEEIN